MIIYLSYVCYSALSHYSLCLKRKLTLLVDGEFVRLVSLFLEKLRQQLLTVILVVLPSIITTEIDQIIVIFLIIHLVLWAVF